MQLAEDSGIGGDLTDASWSAGAFEVGPDRRHRAVEQSHNLHAKPRSVSLSRTEDTAAKEAAVHGGPDAGCKPSAGSSTTKLARSKSSVEKKIQHEVAVFWRKTKEGRLFHRKENNHDKDVSLSQVKRIVFSLKEKHV